MARKKSRHTRREFFVSLGAGACGLALSDPLTSPRDSQEKPERLPNIVLIIMDDMGYVDLGCYGAVGYETRAIDRLATEGLKFTDFYVSQAVCSASRASLLTGCYAERVGIQGALMPWATVGLGAGEETTADLLKKRGYATACFGKWHLGHHRPFLPLQHGFDEYFGPPYAGQEPGRDGFPGRIVQIQTELALYDLAADIGETRNVAAAHPDVVAELQALAETAREELGDALTGRTGKGVREPGRLVPEGPRTIAHAAVGRAIQLAGPPSPRYPGRGDATLLDGERGSFDCHDGKWLGFEGLDFEAVVDLGGPMAVEKVARGFLEEQASWIFLPARVDIAVSADGESYASVGTFAEKPAPAGGPRVKDYAAAAPKETPVRFVRVRASSISVCPSWHIGAGRQAWLFIDEIMIA